MERQRAIAVWAGTAGIGIGLGPVAGGLLLRWFYWGSVFWVNVPICIVALVAGRVFVPDSRDPRVLAARRPGRVAVDRRPLGARVRHHRRPVGRLVEPHGDGRVRRSRSLALGGFVVVELRRPHPMLDLRLFRNPRFSAASLAVTALYFCLFGTIFFQTQHLQFVLGYDPLGAGLRTLPFAVRC